MTRDAFCGIDMAFAKGKLLPVAVCVRDGAKVRAKDLRGVCDLKPLPRGKGNRMAFDRKAIKDFAEDTVAYLREIEKRVEVRIIKIAIDAPRKPAQNGERLCEQAIRAGGGSCFRTPTKSEWRQIEYQVRDHLECGKSVPTLPHANQLWMQAGFALFERLEQAGFECIETFPSAIVRAFDRLVPHKKTQDGFQRQLEILKRGVTFDDRVLKNRAGKNDDDRLDALLCAWVASADSGTRKPYGDGNDDTIWVIDQSKFP